jgi:hypothetical protein
VSIKDIIKKLQKIENQLPYNTFVSDGNNNRINTSFYFDKDSKSGYLEVIFGDLCIGPPGFAHGGAIPLNTKIFGEFSVENIKGRTVKIGGRLVSEDEGTLFAAASGIFVVVNAKKFENQLNQDGYFNKFGEFFENLK